MELVSISEIGNSALRGLNTAMCHSGRKLLSCLVVSTELNDLFVHWSEPFNVSKTVIGETLLIQRNHIQVLRLIDENRFQIQARQKLLQSVKGGTSQTTSELIFRTACYKHSKQCASLVSDAHSYT